jgi:hypothetical protein
MTLFRHKNGLLYTLAYVRRRAYTEVPQLEATPYHHTVKITTPRWEDFTAIAHR